jgi:hypothetical protein
LSGGSREDVKHAAVTSLITGIAGSSAAPTHPGPGAGPEEHPSSPRKQINEPEPLAAKAQAANDPSASTKPKDPISLDEFRQKKLASQAKAPGEEKSPSTTKPKAEATVSSLEEARQRKRIAAAKKPEPPSEPQSQVASQVQEAAQQAEMKQAVGAEGQTLQPLEPSAPTEGRLKIVASASGNGSKTPGRPQPQGTASGSKGSSPRIRGRRPSRFTTAEIEADIAEVQEKVPERKRVVSEHEAAEEKAVREQETADTPESQLADRQHSRALRDALEAAGIPVPPGHDAHHIVPSSGGGAAGDRARAVLERESIHLDHAENGVPLPATTLDPATIPEGLSRHQTIHTRRYYEALLSG